MLQPNPEVQICVVCGTKVCCPPDTCNWQQTSVSCSRKAWLTGAPPPSTQSTASAALAQPSTARPMAQITKEQPMFAQRNPVRRRPVGPPAFPQWHPPASPSPWGSSPGPMPVMRMANPGIVAMGPYSANPGALRNPWPGAEYSGYQAGVVQPMLGGMPGVEYSGYQRNAFIGYGAGVGRTGYQWQQQHNPCGAPMPMMANPCGAPPQYGPDRAPQIGPYGTPMMANPCGAPPQYPPDRAPQYGPDRAPPMVSYRAPMMSNPCGPRVPQYGPDRAPRLNPCDCDCGPQSNPCGCAPGSRCCVEGQACDCGPQQNPCMQGSPCCPTADARLPNPSVQLSCKNGYELSCVSFGGPKQECKCKLCGGQPYACHYAPPVVTQVPYQQMGALATTSSARMVYPNPCGQGVPCCPTA